MEGYSQNGKKVDVSWWMKEISAGEQDRDAKTNFSSWDTWRSYYRSDFADGIWTKNAYFMIRRSMVPKLYFRNPAISVLPKKPGAKHAALAKIMERIYSTLMDSMRMKWHMKKIVDTGFITGTAVGKLGFGAEFSPTPDPLSTEAPINKNGFRNEYRSGIIQNMPWFLPLQTENFVLPKNCDSIENSYFQAHWITRYRDDVENDPRLKNVKFRSKNIEVPPSWRHQDVGIATDTRDTIDLLEIRDRRTRKVIVLAPKETNEVLYFEDDELQTHYSSPFYLYTPNQDDVRVWGVPDAKILEPFQEQLNEIKTKIFEHARASIVKFLIEKGSVDESEAVKMTTDDLLAFVNVNKLSGVQQTIASNIPDGLLKQEEIIMNDIRESMGFSRNQFGDVLGQKSHSAATATEVQSIQASSELRLDERRDMLSDILVNVFKDIQQIIFRHWSNEQVIDVVGSDGLPIWVEFTGAMLKEGDYELKLDPDSNLPETRDVRNARASAIYRELVNNPNVDQMKLTKYRIREMPGVSTSDLLIDEQSSQLTDVNGLANIIEQQGNVLPFQGATNG